jgi:hypothetical protein
MTKVKKIRICMPFDQVCLQSGCIHCEDRDLVSFAEVEKVATEKGWLADFELGQMLNGWQTR